MTTSTLAKNIDLQQWSGYSRSRCEREFRRAHNCTRIWSLRQLRKKSHNNANDMSVETQQNHPQPNRSNNPSPPHNLKLGLWNVRSIGKDEKLLSILEDAIARHTNILVLTEARHSWAY